jgi:hypothetical protein
VVLESRIQRTTTPADTVFTQLRALQSLANLAFVGDADERRRLERRRTV